MRLKSILAVVAILLAVTAVIVAMKYSAVITAKYKYWMHQVERGRMKLTITRMSTLGQFVESRNIAFSNCQEAAKADSFGTIECKDGWGGEIHLQKSLVDGRPVALIWAQGSTPETARFLYSDDHFQRLPPDAPP